MRPIIRIQGLGKYYRIGDRAAYGNLRESITNSLSGALRAAKQIVSRNGTDAMAPANNHIWALRDVSFDVMPGEVLGVIGHNGAGKSTLLKILSRITEPTTGRVDLYGRVGSLLEVGTGFHPELTGRENVFLNGVILGMRRGEITRKFDQIVSFAEVEKFIDTPVKHYSSGMYVRLAFAVAAYLEPAILLVDEVLAVGDARFWSKSTARMRELSRQGSTIVLVSHNMWLMQTMASRAVWLRSGQVAEDGGPLKVISLYRQYSESADRGRRAKVTTDEPVRIGTVGIFPESRWASAVEALSDSGVRVVFPVEAAPGSSLMFLVRLTNPDGLPYFTVYSKLTQMSSRGRATVEAVIPHLMLMPGEYRLWVAVCSEQGEEQILATESMPLRVVSEGHAPASFNLLWNEARWRVIDSM